METGGGGEGKVKQGGAGGVPGALTTAIAAPLPPRQGALFRLPTVIDSWKCRGTPAKMIVRASEPLADLGQISEGWQRSESTMFYAA